MKFNLNRPVIGIILIIGLSRQAWADQSFSFISNQLEIPVVNVPDSGIYDAKLARLSNGQFELQTAVFAESSVITSEENPATFSFDDGIVRLPKVNVLFPNQSQQFYSAELKLIAGSTPLTFELLSATAFQEENVTDAKDPVSEQLAMFDIDTSETPRIDIDGNDLPVNFSPIGATANINRTDELFLLGIQLEDEETKSTFIELTANGDSLTSSFTTDTLNSVDNTEAPWENISLSSSPSVSDPIEQTLRAATAADLDNDGQEETLLIYKIEEAGAFRLKINRINDKAGNFNVSDGQTLAFIESVEDISITAADLNGDGDDEIAVALAERGSIHILFFDYENDSFVELENTAKQFDSSNPGAFINTSLETGNIDYDNAEEIALVTNEIINGDEGIARYYLYDDLLQNLDLLEDGVVQGADEIGVFHSALIADISMGDIDGDGLDEIVFAGLRSFQTSCESHEYIMVALDDRLHDFENIGNKIFSDFLRDCPAFAPWRLRYVHVNTVDLDGDKVDEIQANQFVFNNFKTAEAWSDLYLLPQGLIFEQNSTNRFGRTTSAFEIGDVTGDGRENIIIYNQARPTNAVSMEIWGDHQINGWSNLHSIPVKFFNAQSPIHPVIVPTNLDVDGPVLKYSEADYRFVFTEPVLIAALAAAPCQEGIGQVIDGCRTRYGTATTVAVDAEAALTLTAGVHAGVKTDISLFGIGAEVEAVTEVTTELTTSILAAYSLEQSVVFTTGPIQDSVIFTTIPLDQYTYVIESHPVPEYVGQEIVISLPRKPITIMAEKDFYNESAENGGFLLDSRVFQHTPGDISTYPTRSEKNSLTNQYFDTIFDVLDNPSDALLDALNILELESELQTVDQGSGSREVTLQVNQSFGVGVGINVSKEYRVSGEAGAGAKGIAGFTVGSSLGANLAISRGSTTLYSGSVGAIDATDFATNVYNYGLFAYTYKDAGSGQEFEVINYWVE